MIKLGLSILIIAVILYQADLSAIQQHLVSLDPLVLLLALGFQLLSQSIASFRWYLIMRYLRFKHAFTFYFKSYFKGSMFNQVLPTSIGGDAYRVAEVKANGGLLKEAFYGVFIDRIVGLVGLLLLAWIAAWMQQDILPESMFLVVNALAFLALSGLVFLMFLHRIKLFRRKIIWFFILLSKRFYFVYKTPSRIASQLFLSVLIHFFSMSAIFTIGMGVGIDLPLITYLILVPPAILLTVLPISFAGWGVREGALIGLFLLVAQDKSMVLTMSLLYGVILIVAAMPGLYFYLRSKTKYI